MRQKIYNGSLKNEEALPKIWMMMQCVDINDTANHIDMFQGQHISYQNFS